jgi:mono/diheme cytochrome c family protein
MIESHSANESIEPNATGDLARWIAYLMSALLLVWAGYRFAEQWRRIFNLRPVEMHLWADAPQAGGWQTDRQRIPAGRPVHLTVHGVSGVHTFALAYTDVRHEQLIQPGSETTVDFVAPAPGRYVLYCTTWCSVDHWRMRTVIDVYDPDDADTPLTFLQSQPRYAVNVAPHALDMPHPGEVWPTTQPDTALGDALWAEFAANLSLQDAQAALDWPNASPAAVYAWLEAAGVGEPLPGDADQARWAMVAALWQQATTPAELAQGQALYQQNCVACHGEQGQGDGFAAAASPGYEPDLTDQRAAAGASPALTYAKIARGGMGTGMPNWGAVLTEDELWALAAYVQSFVYQPAQSVE